MMIRRYHQWVFQLRGKVLLGETPAEGASVTEGREGGTEKITEGYAMESGRGRKKKGENT